MRIIAFLLAILPSLAFAADLKSAWVVDTNPFLCENQPSQQATWTNNTGGTIYIRQTVTFMGVDMGGKGDFFVMVERVSDGAVLQMTNWDHYAEPTGLHNLVDNYAPHYFALPPGDSLRVTYDCTLPGQPSKHGHVITRILYTDSP